MRSTIRMFLYVKEFTVKRVSYKHSQLECCTYSIVCRGSVQKHPITSQLSLLETYFKCDVQVNQVYTLYSHNNNTIGMKCKANMKIRSSCIQTADKIMSFAPFHLFFSTYSSAPFRPSVRSYCPHTLAPCSLFWFRKKAEVWWSLSLESAAKLANRSFRMILIQKQLTICYASLYLPLFDLQWYQIFLASKSLILIFLHFIILCILLWG